MSEKTETEGDVIPPLPDISIIEELKTVDIKIFDLTNIFITHQKRAF